MAGRYSEPMLPQDDAALLREAAIDPPSDPAQGLFREDSWLRRVSREPALLFGGGGGIEEQQDRIGLHGLHLRCALNVDLELTY